MSSAVPKPQSKVFIETIKQIHAMIETDSLKPGDKLPSERELSDRLKVGRSSVREALRALELLGLIETKRGEGTFVKDFGGHHLVELVGSFILQNDEAKEDLLETRMLIEEQALVLACEKMSETQIELLKRLVIEKQEDYHETIMRTIILCSNNRLLFKIWLLLSEYDSASSAERKTVSDEVYEKLISSFEQGDREESRKLYRKWRG
ncbi:FadR/GntR family transcriptional regulator [Bacillus sp. DJP31]|uniref:FadR/GntR family transcriptional regulator n=1 Tax=Bacillus sp. DJP31 TaxID=3409789 RepID=UPI003BB7C009